MSNGLLTILTGDALEQLRTLPDESVHCCVTSPPYWGLRDYGVAGQIGLERTPEEYVAKMVEVFREVRRVLREDGTCWVNLGSSYFSEGVRGSGGKSPKQISNSGSFFDDKRPIQSHSGVPACGSDGKGLQDSTASDCACSCLCDGCRDALGLTHNENICPLHGQSASLACTTNHDSGRSDSSTMPQDASLPDAQESTMRQSSPPHQGGCLHCSNCGACLSVLRSSSRDARLCVRNSCLNHTIVHPVFKPKDMVPIPWMVAMALQQDGWWLRSEIIWHKPNPMPESVTDRPTKAHEYLFLLAKSEWYYYNAEAIKDKASVEPHNAGYVKGSKYAVGPMNRNGHSQREDPDRVWAQDGTRNKRSVWTVPTAPYSEAHFATFPPDLIKPCILAGCPAGGTVLDPFFGSGTTGMVSLELGRKCVGIELKPEYVNLAENRCNVTPGFQL